ncbi:type VI secretion system protein TssA [Vibrio atypicus]|uniref:type VI secretion system protein TssA n=1 Tax=Vibrio atypicus TaxID=558271 RepID=UPI0037352D79
MLKEVPSIELELIAEPVLDELPSGNDPRMDSSPLSPYFFLKDVRNQARAAERNALVDNEPLLSLSNLWDPIIEQVPNLLHSSFKDLELAAWLIEAMTRRNGFAGFALGCDVARTLIENHWDSLFPYDEDDGPSDRVAPLIGLNGYDGEGTLLVPIASIPLTDIVEEQPYSLWEYEQASEIERLDRDKKEQKIALGGISLDKINNTVKATNGSFFIQCLKDIEMAQTAYHKLSVAIDDVVGDAQPSSHITKRLESCAQVVRYLAGDKLIVAQEQQEVEQLGEESTKGPTECNQHPTQKLNTRSEAIEQLEKIASFFKQTEPHSPMAYGIEQVIRWSEMALPDLLQELISDNEARAGYFRLTGIKPEKND